MVARLEHPPTGIVLTVALQGLNEIRLLLDDGALRVEGLISGEEHSEAVAMVEVPELVRHWGHSTFAVRLDLRTDVVRRDLDSSGLSTGDAGEGLDLSIESDHDGGARLKGCTHQVRVDEAATAAEVVSDIEPHLRVGDSDGGVADDRPDGVGDPRGRPAVDAEQDEPELRDGDPGKEQRVRSRRGDEVPRRVRLCGVVAGEVPDEDAGVQNGGRHRRVEGRGGSPAVQARSRISDHASPLTSGGTGTLPATSSSVG